MPVVKPTWRDIWSILKAWTPILFVTILCLVGAYFSYATSKSYQLSTFLGVVGKNITSGYEFETHSDVLQAVETGLKTKDKYFKFFYTEDEFNATWLSLEAAITKKFGILFDSSGVVKDVLKHSPNTKTLFPGDKIIKVENESDPKKFLSTFETLSKSNLSASITVVSKDITRTVSVTPFQLKSVYVEPLDGNLKVTVYYFKTETTAILAEELQKLNSKAIKSVTFDLSQCPGGKVKSLTTALSFFLPRSSRLFYEDRKKSKIAYVTAREPLLDLTKLNAPITIIQSKRTASSAELFIGALRYNLDSKVKVESKGDTTYGKWTTIHFVKFLKGGIIYSVGRVYLPNSITYEGTGLTADSPL